MDRGDFAAAVDRHYSALVQRLTLVLHDAEEAKDVAQEAYLRAFRSRSSITRTGCGSNWWSAASMICGSSAAPWAVPDTTWPRLARR